MGNNSGHDDDDDRKDLTRIEDLSEFLHEEDSEIDNRLGDFNRPEPSSIAVSLDALDDNFEDSSPEFGENENLPDLDQVPPELPDDVLAFETDTGAEGEDSLGDTADWAMESETSDEMFSENSQETTNMDFSFEETSTENPSVDDISADDASSADFPEEEVISFEESVEPTEAFTPPEKFEDVKTFAQNFSYGQSHGGGNPPYSIIVKNIKFKEEAEDIISLLREFGLLTSANENETKKALDFGSLLIPQISEYCAIILAHKLRRFDLDLEVGLADEIHPSKSGEMNPRGLLKKESLKQNKAESMNFSEIQHSIKDVLLSTSSTLSGYKVLRHLGVQTTSTIIEDDELEKLSFVSRNAREKTPLYDHENAEEYGHLSSDRAFKDYQHSFEVLYEDLTNQLKQKALSLKANALLGLNYQLSPLQFDRREKRINAYQIICSATLAFVVEEN